MKILCYYFFLFLTVTTSIFAQSLSQEQQVQEEHGSDIQQVPQETVAQSTQSQDITIKNVNQTYYSKTVSPDGYTKAVLTGSVHIVYMQKDIFADEIVIRFLGGKAKILIAKGNVLLKSKERTTVSRELFIYLESKNIQFLDPITLQNNIYVRGLGLRYTEEDLTRLTDISMTTSLQYFPRYTLNAADGWIEKDNDFILLNAFMQIGQDPLIYFPIFYNNHYGTGMITNITNDSYLGFMIFNTFSQKTTVQSEKFMFDYYQKLGMYLGNDFSKTDIGTLQTHIGLAYDYHAQYNAQTGTVENVFEQILGQGPSVGRSFRYNFSIDYDKQLIQPEESDDFSLRYKGSYKELSDPDFVNQFESKRYDQFDLKNLFFSDNEGYNRVQSGSSSGEGRRFDNSITMAYYGYNLQISSSMLYNLNPKTKNDKTNTYSASYWKNTPNRFVLPQIDFNKSYLIYTLQKDFQDQSKITMPIKLDINYGFSNIANYQAEGLASKDASNSLRAVFSSNITYDTSSFFKLYLPLSIENLFKYDYAQYYAYQAGSTLTGSNSLTKNSVTANYSPELTFRILDNITLTNTVPLSTIYENSIRKSDNPTTTQIAEDKTATYNNTTQKMGETLRLEWVDEEWEYLSGYFSGSYLYTLADHSGHILPTTSWTKVKTHAASVEANFFKTTLNINSSNSYGTGFGPESSLSPLEIKLDSTSIPFVTISNTYTWDRYNKTPSTNNLSFTASVPSRLNIADWLWFSSIDITLNWSSDFRNPMLDYLNYKFSLIFNVTSLWTIEFLLSGKNQQLYLYGDTALTGRKKNFFTDLFQSFALWSTRLRQESSFKMQNFGITVSHDLDEWVLSSGFLLEPKVRVNGSFYFDTQFYIEVILKDLGMLTPPRMSQGTDNGITTT